MARVAAYLRRSSPGELDKNYSIDLQFKDIAAWAEEQGHIIVAKYSDPGGKSFTLNRPVLKQAFTDARDGKFDILAVWKFDRLSRIQDQSIVAIYQLKQCNVQVISITQPLPEGPVGNVLLSTYQFASEMELNYIRERTFGGKLERVHSGKLPPMNYPKYGYVFADDTKASYLPDPETAPVVQRIFILYTSGETIRSVAAMLTNEGVPTPAQYMADKYGFKNRRRPIAADWRAGTIYKMLTDTGYIGKLVGFEYSYTHITRVHPVTKEIIERVQKTKRLPNDPNRYEYPPEVCPPIVSREIWDRAQEMLSVNKERASRRIIHPHTLLLRNGLGRCGFCKRGLAASWSKQTGNHRYLCAARSKNDNSCPSPTKFTISAELLDQKAWDWFIDRLGQKEIMEDFYRRYEQRVHLLKESGIGEIEATQKALEQARDEAESYFKAVGSARTDEVRARFITLAEDAQARYGKYVATLQNLEAQVVAQQNQEDLVRSLQEMNEQARLNLANASIEDRRLALYTYRVRAWLWNKEHEPHYHFTWMFDEDGDDQSWGEGGNDSGGPVLSLDPFIALDTIAKFLRDCRFVA